MSWLSAIKTRVVVGYEKNRCCDMDMEVEVEVGDRWPIDVESGDDDSVMGEMARWQLAVSATARGQQQGTSRAETLG
jgi:hypothetical protein